MNPNKIFIQKCVTSIRVFKNYDSIYGQKFKRIRECFIPKLHYIDKASINLNLNRQDFFEDFNITNVIVSDSIIAGNYLELSDTYNPIEEGQEIFTELPKIKDEDSLRKFIKTYGLPLSDSYNDFDNVDKITKEDYFFPPISTNYNELCFFSMKVNNLFFQLSQYQYLFFVWVAIKNNEKETLRRIRDQFKEEAESSTELAKEAFIEEYIEALMDFEIDSNHDEDEDLHYNVKFQELLNNKSLEKLYNSVTSDITFLWNKVKNESLGHIAKAYFSYLLNKMPSGEIVTTYENGYIIPALKFNDLFEVAYYQLKQAVYSEAQISVCLYCNNFFIQDHGNQKFCRPNRHVKESSCRNTYKKRKQRANRQKSKSNNS
ncbi:hypothetical protein [Peribacillus sp. Hz7]|uniref:hypothetical protein n=1 Tax=Peribacillus sp. Hz7 TaxID=3344873 RepID=UPI0035CBFCAC